MAVQWGASSWLLVSSVVLVVCVCSSTAPVWNLLAVPAALYHPPLEPRSAGELNVLILTLSAEKHYNLIQCATVQ